MTATVFIVTEQGHHFSFFQGRGGKILTYFLGKGEKYENKQHFKSKNTTNPYFSKSGVGKCPPAPPPK